MILSAAAGNWWVYRLRARANPKLVEGLVCLSTGVVLAAHTLVDRDEFTPYSSGLTETAGLVRCGLTDSGVPEFQFPTGPLSHSAPRSRVTQYTVSSCAHFAEPLVTLWRHEGAKPSPSEGGLLRSKYYCTINKYTNTELNG